MRWENLEEEAASFVYWKFNERIGEKRVASRLVFRRVNGDEVVVGGSVLSGLRRRERVDRIKAPGANYTGDDQVARKLNALPADWSARARRVITLMRHVVAKSDPRAFATGITLQRLSSDSCASLRNHIGSITMIIHLGWREHGCRSCGDRASRLDRDHKGRGRRRIVRPLHLEI